jgi:hypothetical protein
MREDILKRAIEGVEDDLDDLGEQLYDDLERYDEAIALAAAALPSWLDVGASALRAPLRLESADLGATMLGPHAVGQAAAKVDAFVRDWLGEDGVVARPDLRRTPGLEQEYERARDGLLGLLARADVEMTEHARAARAHFEAWGDELLYELELRRKRDAEAIEALVAEGTIEPGRDTRSELAELWEEQRRKAAHLEERWVQVEELAERGEALGRAGLKELVALVEHVAARLAEGFPEVTAPQPVSDTLVPDVIEERALETQPPRAAEEDAFSFFEDDDDADTSPPPMLYDVDDAGPTSPPQGDEFDPYSMLEESSVSEDELDDPGPTSPPPPSKPTSEALAEPELAASGPMIDFFDEEDGADTSAFYISHAASDEPLAANVPPDTTLDYDVFQSVEDPSTLSMQLVDDEDDELDAAALLPDEATAAPDAPGDDEVFAFDVFNPPAPAEPEEEPAAPEVAHDTLLLDDGGEPEEPVDEVAHDTLLLDAREDEPEADDAPAEAEEEEDAPALEAGAADVAEVAVEEAAVEGEDGEEDAPEEEAEPAAEPAPPAEPARAPERAAKEDPPAERPRPTPTTLRARRRRPGVVRVSRAEVALALGLPLALAVGLAAAASSTALPGWTRWLGVALLVWFVVGPLVMGWRARWRGWVPLPTRRATLVDEASVEVTEEAVRLGPWSVRWGHGVELSRERWAEPDQGSRGWALHVGEEGGDRLTFSVALSDEEAWGATGWPLAGAPKTPWELDAADFAELSESVDRISASLASRGEAT